MRWVTFPQSLAASLELLLPPSVRVVLIPVFLVLFPSTCHKKVAGLRPASSWNQLTGPSRTPNAERKAEVPIRNRIEQQMVSGILIVISGRAMAL